MLQKPRLESYFNTQQLQGVGLSLIFKGLFLSWLVLGQHGEDDLGKPHLSDHSPKIQLGEHRDNVLWLSQLSPQ